MSERVSSERTGCLKILSISEMASSKALKRMSQLGLRPPLTSRFAANLINTWTVWARAVISVSHWSKQRWHRRQEGKSFSKPRPHLSQNRPVTPARHLQAPVALSHVGWLVPSGLHSHAARKGQWVTSSCSFFYGINTGKRYNCAFQDNKSKCKKKNHAFRDNKTNWCLS